MNDNRLERARQFEIEQRGRVGGALIEPSQHSQILAGLEKQAGLSNHILERLKTLDADLERMRAKVGRLERLVSNEGDSDVKD